MTIRFFVAEMMQFFCYNEINCSALYYGGAAYNKLPGCCIESQQNLLSPVFVVPGGGGINLGAISEFIIENYVLLLMLTGM